MIGADVGLRGFSGLICCDSEETDRLYQDLWRFLTADFGIEGIAREGVGFTDLAGFVADLTLDAEFDAVTCA